MFWVNHNHMRRYVTTSKARVEHVYELPHDPKQQDILNGVAEKSAKWQMNNSHPGAEKFK